MQKTNTTVKRSTTKNGKAAGSKVATSKANGSNASGGSGASGAKAGGARATGSRATGSRATRSRVTGSRVTGSRTNSAIRGTQGRANNVSKAGSSGKADESKLKEFFLDELKDIYWAEKKLVKTLPKLAKAATSNELREAFESHLEETKGHVDRLEKVFQLMGERAVAKKCDAMEGITEEGSSVIEDTDKGTATRDVALVMAGQKAEHYEIATYGGLAQIAHTLGLEDAAGLLEETLEEEKQADIKLTEIAENGINYEASEEEE